MPIGNYWIEEEEQILRRLWEDKTFMLLDIAGIMMRTQQAIKAKARSMGLVSRDTLEAQWRVERIKKNLQEIIEA